MRTKYEEKTYESYFNSELSRKADIYFPIGQVQEGNFGFDAAFFVRNRRLWRRIGFPFPFWHYPFHGVEFREIADEMEDFLQMELDHLPTMKTNLLFQYKKPEYIYGANGGEWHLWDEPYFRYWIYEEQQNLLMHIHNSFRNQVLVLYAAPAIKTIDELVEKYSRQEIIDISNFTKAVDLNNHSKNTYVQAGNYSIACSEPERLERFDLLKELEISDEIEQNNNENNRDFIINFKNGITSLIIENNVYAKSFTKLNENLEKVSDYKLFHSFLVMQNFKQLTGMQWLISLT